MYIFRSCLHDPLTLCASLPLRRGVIAVKIIFCMLGTTGLTMWTEIEPERKTILQHSDMRQNAFLSTHYSASTLCDAPSPDVPGCSSSSCGRGRCSPGRSWWCWGWCSSRQRAGLRHAASCWAPAWHRSAWRRAGSAVSSPPRTSRRPGQGTCPSAGYTRWGALVEATRSIWNTCVAMSGPRPGNAGMPGNQNRAPRTTFLSHPDEIVFVPHTGVPQGDLQVLALADDKLILWWRRHGEPITQDGAGRKVVVQPRLGLLHWVLPRHEECHEPLIVFDWNIYCRQSRLIVVSYSMHWSEGWNAYRWGQAGGVERWPTPSEPRHPSPSFQAWRRSPWGEPSGPQATSRPPQDTRVGLRWAWWTICFL